MSNLNDNSPLKLKRINKEVYMLQKRFSVNLIINNNSQDILINTYFRDKKCLIHIRLLNEYPFKCPIVYLNGIHYDRFLKQASIKHNITSMCLCCKSILCPDNWKPGYKLTNVIDEIFNYSLYYLYFLPVDVCD